MDSVTEAPQVPANNMQELQLTRDEITCGEILNQTNVDLIFYFALSKNQCLQFIILNGIER